MSQLMTQPQLMSAAADDLAGLHAVLAEANANAAGSTTGLAAAAADEVSTAAAQLFDAFGREYQQVTTQAAVFHEEFARALASSGLAYAETEVTNAAAAAAGSLGSIGSALPAATVAPLPPADLALIMGGSGLPIPGTQYISNVLKFVATTPAAVQGLFTPEGLYPLTGVKSLPLDTSVSQGLTILNDSIFNTLAADPNASITVLGYSQSAIISSLEMRQLASMGNPIPADQLSFTLLGNQMTPNGGIFARFPGLSLPSLGIDFSGATPSDTPYRVNNFTLQYDGYADFPRYPINLLADLNAFAGIEFVHGHYPGLDPNNLPAGYNLVQLPTSPNYYADGGATNYYMITTPHPPLMQLVRSIPVIGTPLADLTEPSVTYMINLGYGDGNYGYSTSPADIPTPFGILPPVNPMTVATDMGIRMQQGGAAFVNDITHMVPSAQSLAQTGSSLSLAAPNLAAPTSVSDVIHSLQATNTKITNAITNVAADTYATLLPTADIANAVVTSLPSYDLNLFLDGVGQIAAGDPLGGLYYAIGGPIAADVGLFTLAGGIQLLVVVNGVESVVGDITSVV